MNKHNRLCEGPVVFWTESLFRFCTRSGKNIFYSLADDHVRDIIEIAVEHLTEED